MTARDKDHMDCLPMRRIKVLGGGIKFSGLRIMENEVAPTSNLKYVQSNPIQNMDRKIMWKMFDRERDFQWNFIDKKSMSETRTLRKWDVDILTSNILRKEGGNLGNLTKWSEKSLAMVIMVSDDTDMLKTSRLFELKDHPIADGELEFPIMGNPFWMSCGRNGNQGKQLKFTTGSYLGSQSTP